MNEETKLVRAGRLKTDGPTAVNPPLVRTSTVLHASLAEMADVRKKRDAGERIFSYGARGTPTTFALEDALCTLEGGDRAFVYPSGLNAIGALFLAFTEPGAHVAISDNIYPPARRLAVDYFEPRGVSCTFFDPNVDALAKALKPNTRLVLLESPGSGTFEILDLPAVAELTRANGTLLAVDNTWSAGVYLKPLELGADLSLQAATKYICGYSDVMAGTIVVRGDIWRQLLDVSANFGLCVSPDDCYVALRGIRSLRARLSVHEEHALRLADWLSCRDDVARVLHPAQPDHPGHMYWERDFTGSSGLFAFALSNALNDSTDAFVDALSMFGIGSSWGGFESLALSVEPAKIRSASLWAGPKKLVRLHAGQENLEDLIVDLEQAFDVISGQKD